MNPLLIEIPELIETERFSLRIPQSADAELLCAAAIESYPELHRWMPWANEPATLETTREFIARSRSNYHLRKVFDYVIRFRNAKDGAVVGVCGIHDIDWDIPKFEIGYWIRTPHTRKGYAGECLNALTKLLFDQFKARRVDLRIDELNEPSWRVAERCGFELEGTLQQDFRYPDGRLRDTRVYAKTAAKR